MSRRLRPSSYMIERLSQNHGQTSRSFRKVVQALGFYVHIYALISFYIFAAILRLSNAYFCKGRCSLSRRPWAWQAVPSWIRRFQASKKGWNALIASKTHRSINLLPRNPTWRIRTSRERASSLIHMYLPQLESGSFRHRCQVLRTQDQELRTHGRDQEKGVEQSWRTYATVQEINRLGEKNTSRNPYEAK